MQIPPHEANWPFVCDGSVSKPFLSSSLDPLPRAGKGRGLRTALCGAVAADRFPSFTVVPQRLFALRPRAKELFIASKSPAEQIQRMAVRNRGTI